MFLSLYIRISILTDMCSVSPKFRLFRLELLLLLNCFYFVIEVFALMIKLHI